jgi:hypothetical protein
MNAFPLQKKKDTPSVQWYALVAWRPGTCNTLRILRNAIRILREQWQGLSQSAILQHQSNANEERRH